MFGRPLKRVQMISWLSKVKILEKMHFLQDRYSNYKIPALFIKTSQYVTSNKIRLLFFFSIYLEFHRKWHKTKVLLCLLQQCFFPFYGMTMCGQTIVFFQNGKLVLPPLIGDCNVNKQNWPCTKSFQVKLNL